MTRTFSQEMSTDAIDDVEWWRRRYSDAEPSGHTLRAAFPNRWFRIYSLPLSKRYPDDASDWETLIDRHRKVASAVLGDHSTCYILTPWWCWKESCFSDFDLRLISSVPEFRPDPDDPPTGAFYGARIAWDFERFEPVLRDVAEDSVRATVVSEDELVAYAPYDGGADLFLPDEEKRDEVKEGFREFLSSRSDGL